MDCIDNFFEDGGKIPIQFAEAVIGWALGRSAFPSRRRQTTGLMAKFPGLRLSTI
jgi:hypothetical protein